MFGLEMYLSVLLVVMTCLHRASSIDKYHAQVRVYVDEEAFSVWKKMSNKDTLEEYFTEVRSYFVEVQNTYESLEAFRSIAITFEIESMEVLKEDVMSDSYTRYGVLQLTLEKFRNSIYFDWEKKPYDLAILITGYPLGSKLGVANIGPVCTVDGVGVLQQKETARMVLVIAHEIGHILGAQHDADKYEDLDCYENNGKVMNPTAHRLFKNQHIFSTCSNGDFERNLGNLDRKPGSTNCLKDGNATVTGKRLGALIHPDEYCKRNRFGGDFVDRRLDNRMCNFISCYEAGGKTRHTTKTLQGMPCGHNKICNKDECVESEDGSPLVSDSCPLGDQPRLPPNFDISCEEIDLKDCSKYARECCHTCNTTNPVFSMTADDVCKKLAGDKFVMIRTSTSHGDQLCSNLQCATSEDGRKFDRKYFMSPNGMACGTNKRCSWGKCVSARNGNPDISDLCPFGDQDLSALGYKGTCQKYSQGTGCSRWGATCCQSCQQK